MSTHQLLLHSLDCNCSIRFSFSFLQFHLKETKRNEAYLQFLEKNLLEEKLGKNLLEEKSLAKTCWRKPALTLSLASSSTSSNSSSLERGHFILSENDCRFTLCGSIYIVESTKNIRQVFIVYAEPEEAGGYYANSEVNFWFP